MEREKLRKRLSEYPGNTAEIVEQQLHAYAHREEEKQNLIRRGLRNGTLWLNTTLTAEVTLGHMGGILSSSTRAANSCEINLYFGLL